MRPLSIIASLIPLILTIISFTFTVLSTTSKQWAYQNFYAEDGVVSSLDQEVKPLWTIYRSPFWTCGRPSNAQPGDYNVTCTRHSLTKSGHRACETLETYYSVNDPAYGDARQCQQIHMAASLSVSSSVFSGLSLLSVLGLTVLSILSPPSTHHSAHHHHAPNSQPQAQTFPTHALLSAWVILDLLLSAALLFLAQFYGILGLIQSAFPNGQYATDQSISANSGPWIQGKASVIYASVGWFAAVLGVGWCLLLWGLPSLSGIVIGSKSGGGREKNRAENGEGREE